MNAHLGGEEGWMVRLILHICPRRRENNSLVIDLGISISSIMNICRNKSYFSQSSLSRTFGREYLGNIRFFPLNLSPPQGGLPVVMS